MSTHVYCDLCDSLIERYEDEQPLQEVYERCGPCRRDVTADALTFDQGFAQYEASLLLPDERGTDA